MLKYLVISLCGTKNTVVREFESYKEAKNFAVGSNFLIAEANYDIKGNLIQSEKSENKTEVKKYSDNDDRMIDVNDEID